MGILGRIFGNSKETGSNTITTKKDGANVKTTSYSQNKGTSNIVDKTWQKVKGKMDLPDDLLQKQEELLENAKKFRIENAEVEDAGDALNSEMMLTKKIARYRDCCIFVVKYGEKYNIDWVSFENILLNPNVEKYVINNGVKYNCGFELALAFNTGATVSKWNDFFINEVNNIEDIVIFAKQAKDVLSDDEFKNIDVKKIQAMALSQGEEVSTRLVAIYGNYNDWLNYSFDTQKYGNISLSKLSKIITNKSNSNKVKACVEFLLGAEKYSTDSRYKDIDFEGFSNFIAAKGENSDVIIALNCKDVDANILSQSLNTGNKRIIVKNKYVNDVFNFMDAAKNSKYEKKYEEIDKMMLSAEISKYGETDDLIKMAFDYEGTDVKVLSESFNKEDLLRFGVHPDESIIQFMEAGNKCGDRTKYDAINKQYLSEQIAQYAGIDALVSMAFNYEGTDVKLLSEVFKKNDTRFGIFSEEYINKFMNAALLCDDVKKLKSINIDHLRGQIDYDSILCEDEVKEFTKLDILLDKHIKSLENSLHVETGEKFDFNEQYGNSKASQ